MTIEQRVDTLERRVTRYRGATWTLALALVAGVVMGQAPRDVEFGTVTCRFLRVSNSADFHTLNADWSITVGGRDSSLISAPLRPEVVISRMPSGGEIRTYPWGGGREHGEKPLVQIGAEQDEDGKSAGFLMVNAIRQ